MFKYLFRKNIKTDSDYKKSRLIAYVLMIVITIIVILVMFRMGENFGSALAFSIGMGSVVVINSILGFRELSNPARLHAARIKVTDERRKQLEIEAWAHIGRLVTVLLIILMIGSLIWKPVTLDFRLLIVLIYGILFYWFYRLRK